MKKLMLLLLIIMPLLSIGQFKSDETGFDPTGFTDNDNIFAGYNCSLAIKNGVLWFWGNNQLVPVRIGMNTNWKFISGMYGLQTDGSLWYWEEGYASSPIRFGTENWVFISSGFRRVHGIKSDGTLWAWGNNEEKSFGDGTNISSKVPIQIGTDNNWVEVSNSDNHTIARKSDGTLWGWCSNNKYSGRNQHGELGLGNTKAVFIPTKLGSFSNKKAVQISICDDGSQAIDSEGNKWAWGGWNVIGVKYTNGKDKLEAEIDNDAKWKSISSNGYTMTFAIKSDNSIWGWGYPLDGTKISQLGYSQDWVKIAGGYNHLLAINNKGTLYAWGDNTNGQLGIGSVEKFDGFTSPLSSDQLDIRNKAIALKRLMDAAVALDNIKFDSIMSTKSKWDISGTYNLTQSDGCIKEIQNYKLIISNGVENKGSHTYHVEQVDGGTGYVDFYEIEDATYDNYKNRLYAKQTEKGGGTYNSYGNGTASHGLMVKIGGKRCLIQDLTIKGGIAKATIHYEEYDAASNQWKFINCTFEGKVILNK